MTRVIDFGKLKAKYKTYETQRKLAAEHDVFLGDTRIINRLPQALGKSFYKSTAKRPIPVDIQARLPKNADGKRAKRSAVKKSNNNNKSDDAVVINACTPVQLAGEIERAVSVALVHLSPSVNTVVRVAWAGWPAEHVAANVEAAAKALIERFVPGKWRNVRGLYVKGSETTPLPVWLTEELWLEEGDVVADGSEKAKALMSASAEKPNIGKKRKSLEQEEAEAEAEVEKPEPAKKKAKKTKVSAKVPEGDDSNLGEEIAERKTTLRKQKKAAKKALEM